MTPTLEQAVDAVSAYNWLAEYRDPRGRPIGWRTESDDAWTFAAEVADERNPKRDEMVLVTVADADTARLGALTDR